ASTAAAQPPASAGRAVPWPSYDRQNDHVVKAGTDYLADIGAKCGRIRVRVGRDGIRQLGGAGGIGGGPQVQLWIPSPGPVTWPDGTPAGKYTGQSRYRYVDD